MTRTQTMVQLNEELLSQLDQEASVTGQSRSSLIRDVLDSYFVERQRVNLIEKYVDGYRRLPPGEPDEWGDLEAEGLHAAHDVEMRLDAESAAQGREW